MTASLKQQWTLGGRRNILLIAATFLLGFGLSACAEDGPNPNPPANNAGIVGTWHGSTSIACLGVVSDEMIFLEGGRFSRLTTSSEVNCVPGSLAVRTTGRYEVDADQGVIKLSNIETDPKEQCLPMGGCQAVRGAASDTLDYTMPDNDTLTLSCGAGCVITYTRS